MKLLFAIKSLNVAGGGAERVLVDVANGLAARGHAMSILTFDPPGPSFYPLDRAITRIDLPFNSPGTPLSLKAFMGAIPRLRAAVRQCGPDVLVAFMHSTFVPVTLATIGLGCKRVFSEHIDARHYHSRPFERLALLLLRRWAAATTIPSQSAHRSFAPAISATMTIVPNPVDVSRFSRCARTSAAEGRTVLCVGRLMEEKDHACLIRAFARIAPHFPQWRLRIVGEGTLRAVLEREVARLGLERCVELPGARGDIADEYAHAGVVAISSRNESFGMVAAEALAAQRPVLAFDTCAGVAEMIAQGEDGVLVDGSGTDEARVAALAAGLNRLLADDALRARLAANGPAAVKRFGIEAVLDRWETLLARVTAQEAAPCAA